MQRSTLNPEEPSATALWELPYIQALQLSLSNLKGVFNLQCHYDARLIQSIFHGLVGAKRVALQVPDA